MLEYTLGYKMEKNKIEYKEWQKSGSLIRARRLLRLRHVVHGFGTKNWGKDNLEKDPALQGFKTLFLRQIHSDMIHVIQTSEPEDGVIKIAGDAAVTEIPGILLVVKTADCLPVLIADENRPVVAAVHCGWRGTVKRILGKTVGLLTESFGCRPSALVAAFGPSISGACYEVGEDVIQVFINNGFPDLCIRLSSKNRGKYFLDLNEANRIQLEESGLKPENITKIDLCTHCENDLFSYRVEKDNAGRNFSFIGLSF